MNMKKAQWLKKPSHFDEYMLHTVKYQAEGKEKVFFTVGEKAELTLTAEAEEGVSVSFVFFHTPEDTIIFRGSNVEISWRGLKSTYNMSNPVTEMKISKKGGSIVFSSSPSSELKINNPAFFSSSSFGIVTEGKGGVTLSVW